MKRDPSGYWKMLGIHATKGGEGSGEDVGHPFRGNQYTDAAGAGGRYTDTKQWWDSLSPDHKWAIQQWREGSEFFRELERLGDAVPADDYVMQRKWLPLIKEALKTAPLTTAPIYRGLKTDLKVKKGETMTMDSLTSFDEQSKTAHFFAIVGTGGHAFGTILDPEKDRFTVLQIDKHAGAPKLPPGVYQPQGIVEREVLVEKGRKFKVTSIEPTKFVEPGRLPGKGKKWTGKIVHLEEI